jgi:hypothetical protein
VLNRKHLYEENSGMIIAATEKPQGNIGGWSDSDYVRWVSGIAQYLL